MYVHIQEQQYFMWVWVLQDTERCQQRHKRHQPVSSDTSTVSTEVYADVIWRGNSESHVEVSIPCRPVHSARDHDRKLLWKLQAGCLMLHSHCAVH
jgi:hypothetical protein